MIDEHQWIEGGLAVESVLQAASREVEAIYIRQDRYDGRVARLQLMAQRQGIPVTRAPADVIAGFVSGERHGGIIASVGPRRLSTLNDLFTGVSPVVFLIDGVEDPYNFGQAVRSMYAAGIDGLIVPPRNWLSAAATVIRASAGASEYMPTAVSGTVEAVAVAQARGFAVAVATSVDARPMTEVDLSGPLLLIIGGEKRGVARAVEQAAELRVSIPYGRKIDLALGTSSAVAVLAFEILRRRQAAQ
jgi:23S rRNA (guanosine2251-2'-O)-methyltransferase